MCFTPYRLKLECCKKKYKKIHGITWLPQNDTKIPTEWSNIFCMCSSFHSRSHGSWVVVWWPGKEKAKQNALKCQISTLKTHSFSRSVPWCSISFYSLFIFFMYNIYYSPKFKYLVKAVATLSCLFWTSYNRWFKDCMNPHRIISQRSWHLNDELDSDMLNKFCH